MNDRHNLNRPNWAKHNDNGQLPGRRYRQEEPVNENAHHFKIGRVSNGITSKLRNFGHNIFHLISMLGQIALKSPAYIHKFAMFFSGQSRTIGYGVSGLVVVFVASLVCYYLMGWRALPVNFLKASIENSLSNNFGGAHVSINQALLQRDTLKGGFIVRLTDMSLKDQNGQLIASSPEMAIGLRTLPLLVGQLEPDSLNLIAPVLHLVRNDQGEWSFWRDQVDGEIIDRPDVKVDSMPVEFAKLGDFARDGLAEAHRQLKDSINLSYIGVRKARVVLHTRANGEGDAWLIPSFTLQYDEDRDNLLLGSGVLQRESAKNTNAWFLFSHKKGDDYIDVETQLRNVVPAELSSLVPVLESLKPLRVGVTGRMNARLHLSDGVESGELSVMLGKGEIGLFGADGPVFELTNGSFDFTMQAGAKHIVIRRGVLNYPSGFMELQGDIWRENTRGVSPDWRFQLYSTKGEFNWDDHSETKKALNEFQFSGRLFVTAAPISIDELNLRVGDSKIVLAHDGSRGPSSILRGRVTNLPFNLLKVMWPKGFKAESRKWFFEDVTGGTINDGTFALPALGTADGLILSGEKQKQSKLPRIDLNLEGVSFKVLNDKTTVHSRDGKLKVRGKSLSVLSKTALVRTLRGGTVKLENTNFYIKDYEPKIPDARIDFQVSADAETMLDVFKQEPFYYKSLFGDNIQGIQGELKGKLSVRLPLKDELLAEDIKYDGSLKLASGAAQIGNFKITSGLVSFDVNDSFIQAKGNMLANGVSTQISWQKHLKGELEQVAPIIISGQFDDADRNQLGVEVNHLIQGSVPVVVSISHGKNDKLDIHVSADLTKARITAKALGWVKKEGRSSTLDFDILLSTKDRVIIENFHIKGDDLTVRGMMEFEKDLYLKAFDFPAVSYQVVSNISLKGELDKRNIWRVKAGGATYDGRGWLKSLLQTGKVGQGASQFSDKSNGIDLNADFDVVLGWQQSKLDKFQLKMERRKNKISKFQATGVLPRGGKLQAKKISKKKADTVIQVSTNDAGEALRFIGFYPNMLGGRGDLKVRYNDKKRQLASKTGLLSIRNFTIASDPVVQEVLANVTSKKNKKKQQTYGSQPQGQEQVSFSRLDAPFSIGQGQFVLHDSNVKGELLGATMRGRIDFRREQVRLGGTYIPLYGLNAAVGAVPLLGDILVGRQGEGILGITFGIYGNLRNPEVLVNPMSFVAPGVFRQIFEFEQGGLEIQARNEKTAQKKTQKLQQSASPAQRLKKEKSQDNKSPETSASNVLRQPTP